jgi:Cof subfamily protein (haloacid dehalogenase superfamily)
LAGVSRIRLLAIDIDGTLLDSGGRLPAANREALADATGRGIDLALVTGRSFHFTRPIADAVGLPVTLVVNNGAVVKTAAGATELRHLLDRDVARRVLEETRAFEDSVAVVFDRPDERQIVFERMDWTHPNRRGYFEKNRAFIAPASGPLAGMLTEDPIQVMFNGSVGPMRALAAALHGSPLAVRYSVAVTEYEHRDFSLVDVNGAGCSKGATLARWAARQGIDPSAVMAVGDNLNDLEMLTFAGTAVVMGNASGALREKIRPEWHVTGTNDEDGLAHAIRRLAFAIDT